MIPFGGNGRDGADGHAFGHPADPIDPTCGSRPDWEEGMRPRKVTARIGFSVNGGHVATISPGRKAVPRVAGAPAETAALKRDGSDDIPAWLPNVSGETVEDIADGTGRSGNAVRPAIGRADAGRHESEDIEI